MEPGWEVRAGGRRHRLSSEGGGQDRTVRLGRAERAWRGVLEGRA